MALCLSPILSIVGCFAHCSIYCRAGVPTAQGLASTLHTAMLGDHIPHFWCRTLHLPGVHSSHFSCLHGTHLVSSQRVSGFPTRQKGVILGMNGVAMDRHGLALNRDRDAGPRKLFKYLPATRDTILWNTTIKNYTTSTQRKQTVYVPRGRRHGRSLILTSGASIGAG